MAFGIVKADTITGSTQSVTVDNLVENGLPATGGTISGDLVVSGSLTVSGTTTTIDTATLSVEDKNIEIANVTTPTDVTADGGGITIKGTTDKTLTWVDSTDCWTFNQSVDLTAGSAAAPALILNGDVNTGLFQSAADELAISTAGTERFKVTANGGIHFNNAELIEKANVTAGKLSDNTDIDLANGMVHLFTTTETTTSTPNIRVDSSTSLDSVMAVGESIAVTIITTAAAAGYSTQLTIDGAAVTENWIGGAVPSDGGTSGVDIYTFTIIKTASATYTVVGQQTKTS